MKNQEQRSSFITIAINNANSAAVAAVEAGEWEVVARAETGGCEGLRLQGPDGKGEAGAWEGLSPGRVGDPWDPIGLWDSMLLGQARPPTLPGLWRNIDFLPPACGQKAFEVLSMWSQTLTPITSWLHAQLLRNLHISCGYFRCCWVLLFVKKNLYAKVQTFRSSATWKGFDH